MSKSKRILLNLLVLFVCLYGLYHVVLYGFNLSNCEYTDEIVPTPVELQNITLRLEKSMYIAIGDDPDHCSPLFQDLKNQFIDNETIDNISVGAKYFTERGLIVEKFREGRVFILDKIIAETKHGIGTIDSGPGPLFYMVLKDQRGIDYLLFTVDLGFDDKEAYFSYSKNGVSQGMLSWQDFDALISH